MKKITKPTVKTLATGSQLVAKQMSSEKGDLMPAHLANAESILFVHQGECTFKMDNKEHLVKEGEAIIIPAEAKHQIEANEDFKGIHFMPNNIEFEFF